MSEQALQEGLDYYLEDGYYVFTEYYHRKRGFCCGNGCRHCPYEHEAVIEKETNKCIHHNERKGSSKTR